MKVSLKVLEHHISFNINIFSPKFSSRPHRCRSQSENLTPLSPISLNCVVVRTTSVEKRNDDDTCGFQIFFMPERYNSH